MGRIAEDILMHYGVAKRSGRYPWGSGQDPYQHSGDFLSRVEKLQKTGMTEKDIADELNLTTSDLRAYKAIAKNERRALNRETARSLREDGYSYDEIAKKMGFNNDSSVRALLDESSAQRMNTVQKAAQDLKKLINEKGIIDVGVGSEKELGVTKEKMRQALAILESEGYPVYGAGIPQITNPGKQIIMKVVCPPGTEHREIYDLEKIHPIKEYGIDDIDVGRTSRTGFIYPESMDSKRLQIVYGDEGGDKKDGIIELRRGVEDISLGDSHYAQVRILVDGNKYLKGMALYSDDLPDGVDVRFNTNKASGTSKEKVLKSITNDPYNPFGSLIKEQGGQSYYYDSEGNKKLSLINKCREEGEWSKWSDTLPSQFLAKQNKNLVDKQLKLTIADKIAEYDEICSLTNPTVKKTLLKSFSDDCDAAAVHLKAAALPRQKYQVILPIPSMKDTEVYAPNFHNGETVALVRFPHGGTFEIPILKVNNKQADAKAILGNTPKDAIGINWKVAERLSGADFDGDTVMVIPCNSSRSKIKITSTKPLEALENFNPKKEYGPDSYGDTKIKMMRNTQTEMGKISNLITDMTLKGADVDEIARAVKHSMVVIDAEKHKLNYKQSEIDNDITSLKKAYQNHEHDDKYGGASTLLSRSKSEEQVPKRQGSPEIDPLTGKQSWKQSDNLYYVDPRTGKTRMRTQTSTKMFEAEDARTLSSGHPVEELYASYANKMKALANDARKEMVNTGRIEYSPTANKTYTNEVNSLLAKLNLAEKNRPVEREAQRMANVAAKAKKQDNPDLTKAEMKKINQQELSKARVMVGAKRETIKISDIEWEAIQAGAISENRLLSILNNVDIDSLRQKATPRATNTLSQAKINHIATLEASGYTTAEIATKLGVSPSTVTKYLH